MGITDTLVITERNLIRYLRLPQLLFFSSIQPIMFLTLFNFVFGGAIGPEAMVPGGKYINFLLPGILVQTMMFGGVQTGIGLADDMGRGIIDRFRSLPMSRLAVIAGRTISDMLRNIIVMEIMIIVGYLYGYRFEQGLPDALAMVGLILLFSYALSWVFGFIGLVVKDTETAQLASFIFIFPLTFASSAYVPTRTMPHWLRLFADNQPVSLVVGAAREFALGIDSGGAPWKALIWTAALLIIFVPLAIRQYSRRVV